MSKPRFRYPHDSAGTWGCGLRRIGLGAIVLAVTLTVGGCTKGQLAEWRRLGMPEPASDRAPRTLALWQGTWIAAIVVGLLVWGLILFAVIRYRRRNARIPPQTRYHVPIEVLFTVVPFIIIAVLFFFTVRDQTAILDTEENEQHTIGVVAFQWSWAFNYQESRHGGTDVWETGTPERFPTLYLPVNETVRFELTSPDVVHSFFVPAFLFKMDAMPGKRNAFELTPTEKGTFAGKCAELCGTYHSRMLFNVKVVSAQKYRAHLADLKAKGQTGRVTGGKLSGSVSGLRQ